MAKVTSTYDDLVALARRYGVDTNEIFISCAKQYDLQSQVIEKMKENLQDNDFLVTKEYVKGRENIMANPLVKELPKHMDSANKTLGMMLNIIQTLGSKEIKQQSKLEELMND